MNQLTPFQHPPLSQLISEGKGDRAIARLLGVTRHKARELIREHERTRFAAPTVVTAGTGLSYYEAACRAVAEAKGFDEVREWEDKAAAVKEYSRRVKNRSLELDAMEIRERARLRRGQLLLELRKAGQLIEGRPAETVTAGVRITLEDLDITRVESSRDQRIAKMGGDSFERLIARCRAYAEEHPEKHSFDVLRVSHDLENQEAKDARRQSYEARKFTGGTVADLTALADSGFRAGAILADPPWQFEPWGENGDGRSAKQHYETSEVGKLLALPVKALAADDCALFLWVVEWDVEGRMAFELIKHWGFTHKTTAFTWVKTNKTEGYHVGQGYWTRANPERCLLATRGSPKRMHADVQQLIVAPVREHSRKPDEIYPAIERLVGGPHLEIYARHQEPGWMSWGDEIPAPVPPHDPETGEVLKHEAADGG